MANGTTKVKVIRELSTIDFEVDLAELIDKGFEILNTGVLGIPPCHWAHLIKKPDSSVKIDVERLVDWIDRLESGEIQDVIGALKSCVMEAK